MEKRDVIIKEYESKIEEISKDNNGLIKQNQELLEKVKTIDSKSLGDILGENLEEENIYEISLLKSEIKSLKNQIEKQTNDLVSLDSMEKENIRIKLEYEQLMKDYKNIKFEMEKIDLVPLTRQKSFSIRKLANKIGKNKTPSKFLLKDNIEKDNKEINEKKEINNDKKDEKALKNFY